MLIYYKLVGLFNLSGGSHIIEVLRFILSNKISPIRLNIGYYKIT